MDASWISNCSCLNWHLRLSRDGNAHNNKRNWILHLLLFHPTLELSSEELSVVWFLFTSARFGDEIIVLCQSVWGAMIGCYFDGMVFEFSQLAQKNLANLNICHRSSEILREKKKTLEVDVHGEISVKNDL